jgi:hypothetical protein
VASPRPRLINGLPATLEGRFQASHNFLFTYISVPSSNDKKCLPLNYSDFLRHFSSSPDSADRLQFALSHALHAVLAADMRTTAPRPADRIRHTSLTMPFAHSILNADLSDPRLLISAPAYKFYLRMRDGRPIANILSYRSNATCICGASLAVDSTSHFLTCRKLRGKQWKRHQLLVKAFHHLAELCGVYSIEESHLPDNKRSDNFFNFPQCGTPYHTDTSVVHPACNTYLDSQAQTKPGYAAAARVHQKVTKYRQIVERIGARFRAHIFETYGGTSHDVELTLADFEQAAYFKEPAHRPTKSFMRCYLQKTLIEGNALVFAEGLKLMPL